MKRLLIFNLPNKAQATTELAVFGSLLLVVVASLLYYAQSLREEQATQLQAYRAAIRKVKNIRDNDDQWKGGIVDYTVIKNKRLLDLSSFLKGQPSSSSASVSVFWAKIVPTGEDPGAIEPEEAFDQMTHKYIRINEDEIELQKRRIGGIHDQLPATLNTGCTEIYYVHTGPPEGQDDGEGGGNFAGPPGGGDGDEFPHRIWGPNCFTRCSYEDLPPIQECGEWIEVDDVPVLVCPQHPDLPLMDQFGTYYDRDEAWNSSCTYYSYGGYNECEMEDLGWELKDCDGGKCWEITGATIKGWPEIIDIATTQTTGYNSLNRIQETASEGIREKTNEDKITLKDTLQTTITYLIRGRITPSPHEHTGRIDETYTQHISATKKGLSYSQDAGEGGVRREIEWSTPENED